MIKARLQSLLVASLLAAPFAIPTGWAQEACGALENAYGPFDYRVPDRHWITAVETHHFDEGVANLRRGMTAALAVDIDYTLRAIPNHPRALLAMMRLAEREQKPRPPGANYTIDCYIDRALRFAPDDANVHTIAGLFYVKRGKHADAVTELEEARRLSGNSPNVNYNLGLAYFELGDYDKALAAAHIAYAGGFELPGLRERLQKAGKWKPLPERAAANQGPSSTSPGPQGRAAAGATSTPR